MQTAACWVTVTCGVFQVLNMHGKVLTVRHQAVNRRKDNRFAVALDSEQNNIHVKDIVKVIDGPHSVRTSCLGVCVCGGAAMFCWSCRTFKQFVRKDLGGSLHTH